MSASATSLVIPAHGTIFHAPVNSKPPIDPLGTNGFKLTVDGPSPWINLGHTSKQNTIAFTKEGGERETLDTFLMDGVRTSTGSVSWGFTGNALQFDQDTLDIAFNGDFDPSTGGYTVTSAAPVQAAVFLYFKDSTGALGFWLPNVELTLGDAPSVDTANFFELPLTGSILAAPEEIIPAVDGRAGLFQIFKTGLSAPAPAWQATTTYALGDRVTVGAGVLEATTAGESGATEPELPAAVGGTVVDGTVTWTRRS